MTRTIISISDLPVIKDLVSPSPSSQSRSSTHAVHSKQRNKLAKPPHPQKQQHHVVIRTPPRSLGDDIESPSGATTTTMLSPPRNTMIGMSPKLSPISHASSTIKQHEERHGEQDFREPPSPFKPPPPQQQQQQQQQSIVDDGSKTSVGNDAPTVASQPSPSGSRSSKTNVQNTSNSASSSNNNLEDSNEVEFVDLTDLFVLLQRREWERVHHFLEKHLTRTTPLLHIVLRHGPPLPVVDLLLASEEAASSVGQTTSTVWTKTDTNGRLPLHAACSCGPEAGLDVISRVIAADPNALQVRTQDPNGRFPLHLAVVTNASEDVVMELMIHYPEASFLTDTHGKLPIEYAREACYGHNRLVVALELAPMFLAASQAAQKRVARASETQLHSLREAHKTYEVQLEDRYHSEKMVLVQEQIECSNELFREKERNIALAEAVLEAKQTREALVKERDGLQTKLDREVLIRRVQTKRRDEELKQILLGKKSVAEGNGGKGDSEEKKESGDESVVADGSPSSSSSEPSLPTLLKRFCEGYESSKRRNELYKKNLERQRATTRNLNVLLATKEKELSQANRRARCDEVTLQAAIDRADGLSEMQESTLAKLSKAEDELKRLKEIDSERERKLAHSERRLRIQEKRLSGVQDLIESLKAAKANDAKRLDLIQEEDTEESESFSEHKTSNTLAKIPSTTLRKDADLSVDLSVEIEMAAMAGAHLDCGNSIATSRSLRCREADLSAELAALTALENKEVICSDRENTSPESTVKSFEEGTPAKQSSIDRDGSKWAMDKGESYNRGTPQTLSTVTTASYGDDALGYGSIETRLAETPPLPEQVSNRNRLHFDEFSPLSATKLDFLQES